MDLSSPRKRKRPSYLDDFFETLVEEEAPISKKKTTTSFAQNAKKDESNKDCCLCGATHDTPGTKWDLTSTTGASKFTFSNVLNKLFAESQLPPSVQKQDFSSGFLCQNCKEFVSELDQLQNQVIGVKKNIIHSFKKSKTTEKKEEETIVSKTPSSEKIAKKKTKKAPKEDVYIIESLREKKDSNFLVKWENYPEEENTWEPRGAIPGFILKFYDLDLQRLGQPAPSLPSENKQGTTEEQNEIVSEDIQSVEESAPKQKTSEKSKKKEDLEEKALEKLWRGEAAPRTPKTKADQMKAELKDPLIKVKQNPIPDDVYNIEALIEKKGFKYLVKWENYPVDQNTWEPKSSIAGFILKYYEEDLTRLGRPAPSDATQVEEWKESLVEQPSEVTETETVETVDGKEVPMEIENNEETETKSKSKQNEEQSKPILKESEDANKKEEAVKPETNIKPRRRQSEVVTPAPKVKESKSTKSETKKTELKDTVKKTKQKQTPDVYNIEALVEKKGFKYLVKWENYPADQNTWEPKSSIPGFILKYYDQDLTRLGKPAPANSEQALEEKFGKEKPEEKKTKSEKPKGDKENPLAEQKQSTKPVEEKKKVDSEKDKTEAKSSQSDKTKEEAPKKAIEQQPEVSARTKKREVPKPVSTEANEPAKKVTEPVKTKPAQSKTKDVKPTKSKKKVEEDVYNIETLVKKKGSKYLVKWENYPSDQNTWEPKTSIPNFILKFYEENPSRLGTPAPSGSQATEEEEEEDFEVEKIMDRRKIKKGKIEYLVKWKNFDSPSEYTWEFGSTLGSVQDMVEAYEKIALY